MSAQKAQPEFDWSALKKEIEKLPSWAAVALAARCAMRVQPLVRPEIFPNDDQEMVIQKIEDVDIAITVSALFASGTAISKRIVAYAAVTADDANAAASDANVSAAVAAVANTVAAAVDAANANAYATYAADIAATAAILGTVGVHIDSPSTDTLEDAATTVDSTLSPSYRATQDDLRFFDRSSFGQPDARYLVDSFMRRPLWPSGEPEGWNRVIHEWAKSINLFAELRPGLQEIVRRHIALRQGKGIDWKEAEKRVKVWFSRRGGDVQQEEVLGPAKSTSEKGPTGKGRKTAKPKAGEATPAAPPDQPPGPVAIERSGATPATADLPSKVDLLGRTALVNALAAMFAAKEQATPFTMVLLGDWGAGKSSVMEQLQAKLSGANGAYPCSFRFAHFNAWEYEHSENIRAGLAQEVIKGLLADMGPRNKFALKFRFACREHPWELCWGLAKLLGLVFAGGLGAWWLTTAKASIEPVKQVVGAGFVVGAAVFIRQVWSNLSPLIQHPVAAELLTYMKLPDYGQHLGLVPVMKKHIKALCELTGMQKGSCKRLVVFVDDLDRCSGECIVATLDAARLVMDIPNTIVVIAIDDRIAFNAVAEHYHRVADSARDGYAIARDYLGKIVQLCVKLEQSADMRSFIDKRLFASVKEAPLPPPEVTLQDAIEPSARMTVETPGANIEVKTPEPPLPVSPPTTERSDPPPAPAFSIMPETATDRDNFAKWASAFQFGNPRQLVRLRNTYRLLLQLNTSSERRDEGRLMALLFWLEYLSGMPEAERQRCEDALLTKALQSSDILALPSIHAALAGWDKTIDTPQYMRDKAYISLFVLPYGQGKQAKTLPEAVNEKPPTSANSGAEKRKASSKRK